MNVLDLFSGIGGFSLGLERAGMRTIAFCEIEEYPRSILRKHWPDVPIFEDVRELHAKDLPESIDLICGGYPCQPFSVAGKRRGAEDDRHLWPEIVRLIRELDAAGNKPAWCLFENVAGHISMGLDTVLSDLEGEGYTCWPLVIPACALNAPHRRDRVWIIANCNSPRLQAYGAKQQTTGLEQCRKLGGFVADTIGKRCKRLRWEGEAGIAECREWTTESPVCGPDDGIPRELVGFGINGGSYEKGVYKISESERSFTAWKVLRAVWENRQVAKASPGLYEQLLCGSVPEVSYRSPQSGWYLGERAEEDKTLCDLWRDFYPKSFEESQDLQQKMFKRIREIERNEKMAKGCIDRVARLKALGNAVVPQIPELIGRAIMKSL